MKIRVWIVSLGFVGCSVVAGPSFASSLQLGRVTDAVATRSGRFFFDHDGTRSALPACQVYRRWVVDASSAAGQVIMTLVLTAQAQGKSVIVNGTGDCKDWPDTEAVDHVVVP